MAPHTSYTLFLPLNYNDGSRIDAQLIDGALNTIAYRAGGLTRFGPGHGIWVSPRKVLFCDRILPVQSVVPTSAEAEAWFTQFAITLAVRFEQEVIFLTAQPLWIVEPK